jgi:hypothetical protein
MKIKLPNFLLSTVSLLLLFPAVQAQVATNYLFSQSSGTYTPITGGSVVIAATDHTISGTTSLDAGTYALALPFSFKFNGTTYTSCNVNVNGNITFGTTPPGTANTTPISVATAYDGAISAMSKDLWGVYSSSGTRVVGNATITGVTSFTGIAVGLPIRTTTSGTGISAGTTITAFDVAAGTITMSSTALTAGTAAFICWPTGEIRAEAIGVAPNRTFIIQFKGMNDYSTTAAAGGDLNFQIQLDEGNNIEAQQLIRIVYGPSARLITTAVTQQVGLRGTTNTDFNNRLGTTDWITTTPGIANNSTVTRTNTNFPASGLTYTWTPNLCTNPPTPGTTTASSTFICSGNAVSFNITGNTQGNGQTYQWQRSISAAGPFTDVGPVLASQAYTIPNITHDSFYRCKLTCTGVSDYSTPLQVMINIGLSGVYTINSALPPSITNFQSFTAAITALNCGVLGPVTFDVDPTSGPYNEQVVIPQVTGASATKRITFNGNGTTIQFAPVTGARYIIKLDGADYVTIKNLNITELPSAYAYGIHLMNDANFDSIINCKIDVSANTVITAAQWAGITASGSTTSPTGAGNSANNLVIMGCKIIGGNIGIALNGSSATARNYYNQVINDTIINFYTVGVNLTFQDSTIVSRNEINRLTMTGTATGVFEGVEITSSSKNCIVSFNRIHDSHTSMTGSNSSYPIFITGADAPVDSVNYIYGNLIYNINSTADVLYGIYNLGSDGTHIYHNTIVLNFAGATAGNTRGFWQSSAATNIIFKNNNVFVSRGGTGTKYCIHFNTATSSIISENNNLYAGTAAGTAVNIGGHNGIDYGTLATWKTANGGAYDQLSKSANPTFFDVAIGDYTPTAPQLSNMCPLIPFITKDITGAIRGANGPFTEPGAYEWTPGPCSASTPIGGDAISSTTLPPCAGGLFSLDLQNNSVNSGQVYSWESSPTPGGPFISIAPGQNTSALQTAATSAQYYRCVVSCPATSLSSISSEVQVQITPALPAGTYTIDAALPASSTNFTSINSAVYALNCGTTGSVIFNIANGTYTERFDISVLLSNKADSIVFQSANADTSLVHIQWPSSTTASNNSIVSISNSRKIFFKNISFVRTGSSAFSTIFSLDTTVGIKFEGNAFVGPIFTATNTTGTQSHIFSDDQKTEDSTIIVGNNFIDNSNALWFYSNPDKKSQGTLIQNNRMTSSYLGIFLKTPQWCYYYQ